MTDETPKNLPSADIKKKRKPLALQLNSVVQNPHVTDQVRQSLSHGRSKNVTVEVKRQRKHSESLKKPSDDSGSKLTVHEQDLRRKALHDALQEDHKVSHRLAAEALFSKPHQNDHTAEQVSVVDDSHRDSGDEAYTPRSSEKQPVNAVHDDKTHALQTSSMVGPSPKTPRTEGEQRVFVRGEDRRPSGTVATHSNEGDQYGHKRVHGGAGETSLANQPTDRPPSSRDHGTSATASKDSLHSKNKTAISTGGGLGGKKRRFKNDAVEHDDGTRAKEGDRSKKNDVVAKKTNKFTNQIRKTAGMSDMSWVEYEDMNRPIVGLKKLRKKGIGQRKKGNFLMAGRGTIIIKERMTIEDFAVLLSEKLSVLIKEFQKMGIQYSSDGWLDGDVAQLFAEEKGFQVKRDTEHKREEALWLYTEGEQQPRPPVVTVMGHVDHGKTSLLDALRQTDVAAKESGGITQHIGAYQVHLASGKVITFIDTPGHEAFTEMRSRGAQTTDMVILVVAADDGINAQTIEAIRHCQAAQVPIIVAINKMDKPGAKPDHVRQQLLQHEIVVEHLGGDVQDVEVSALKNMGLDRLEEAILLQAEVLGLQAYYEMKARGVILETRMKKGYGAAATFLVQNGTLKKGDVFVVGHTWGRAKLIFNEAGDMLQQALPSQPVEIVGFSQLPESGDRLMVVANEAEAKDFVEWKKKHVKDTDITPETPKSISHMLEQLKVTVKKEKAFVLKVDAQGSLEGIMSELNKIVHDEVQVKIVYTGVGPVNEGDVLLAETTQATILCFNVTTLPEARKLIENRQIPVLQHSIIYRISEDVKRLLSDMLDPVYQEEVLGKALVMQVFPVKKEATIAGCIVKDGIIKRGEYARVIRGGKIVYDGVLKTLRHIKDDVKERSTGQECGITFDNFNELQTQDEIHCYTKKRVERHI